MSEGCLFCRIAAGEVPAFVVASDADTVSFLDTRPVFKGHTLVVPRRHVDNLVDLPAELIPPVFGVAQRLAAAMAGGFGAAGSFVAVNNTVSQSQPHLHVHVVPRNRKDGLRGFFWPRTRYDSDAEAEEYAQRVRDALG